MKDLKDSIEQPLLVKTILPDPIVSENALKVLKERYLARDDQGNLIEDPKDMYIRVASAIARVEKTRELQEKWALKFYDIMATNRFLPNSPCLMNAGRRLGMLSACFVLPVQDNLEDIFSSVKATTLVQRAGGGTGFNFSNLRPNGSIVKSSGGTTAGPLSFIDVFSQATSTIQQGAFRRGANMGILHIRHPDVVDFIRAKEDLKRWQNYNISVAMTDEFMEELELHPGNIHKVSHKEWGEGALYYRSFEQPHKPIAFKNRTSEDLASCGYLPWTVKDTWNLICTRAHNTGEPGLFFIDEANKNNPVAHLGRIEATNPCGEQPLHAYDSCNLGSINLAKYYSPTSSTKFDYVNFEKDIVTAVRFLDNVIDANRYPIPEIEKMSKATRRIGLGVMGFADLLFKLELGYNTIGALEKAERIGANFNASARKASADLAEEKGIAPALKALNCGKECFYRNAFRTTVAPTGTISIIANCSGGIEPLFALAFKRTVMPDANGKFKEMYEQNEHFTNALMSLNSEVSHLGIEDYARQHGSIKNYSSPMSDGKARKLREIFVTSHDIDPSDHVKMQIVWQSCVDTAISKTINLPHDAPVEVVSKVYWEAYYGNCKGITVYRDGCRNNVAGMKQPMSVEKTPEFSTGPDGVTPVYGPTKIALNAGNHIALKELVPVQREKKVTDVYPAFRTQIKTQYGNLHVCIVLDEDGKTEREIFAQLGKAGDIIAADLEAICRVASLSLRNGVSLEKVIDQLKDIGSTHVLPSAHGKIVSMPDALAKALQKYALRQREGSLGSKDVSWETSHTPNTKPSNKDTTESNYGIKCPACTVGTLSFQEGCQKCHSCGYSAC